VAALVRALRDKVKVLVSGSERNLARAALGDDAELVRARYGDT
jgi:hypothetical protein